MQFRILGSVEPISILLCYLLLSYNFIPPSDTGEDSLQPDGSYHRQRLIPILSKTIKSTVTTTKLIAEK